MNKEKEIEELKKKLEELEKASLNNVNNLSEEEKEKTIPKKEREEIINKGVDFDGEIRKVNPDEENPKEEEEPKKKKGWWKSLPLSYRISLIILSTVISICIKSCMENSNSYPSTTGGSSFSSAVSSLDKNLANQSDDVRGYSVVNDYRVWWDENLYQKNQEDKSQCFYYQPQGDYDPVPVCPATKLDIQIAKEKGIYVDDPSSDFTDTAHIVSKPLTAEEKAEEDKGIDPVTVKDSQSTYISKDGNIRLQLIDGWIVQEIEGHKKIPFKGNAVIEFYGQVGEMVDGMETNTGQFVVGLSSWYQPEYTIVFKENDPSSKMIVNLIKDQIAKDLNNEDLNGARIIFKESCGLFTTSAHSIGVGLYKGLWRGEMVYLKTSSPLKLLETRVDKWCKGDGGPGDECTLTKEYYIGK